jgi:hypothetical protein
MSLCEKSAWISFMIILVAFGAYFMSIGVDLTSSMTLTHHSSAFLGLVGAIVAVTTIEIATHIAVAIQSPAEAQSARDEREKVIALKATRPAFYVFMAGVWLALGVVVAGGGVWILVQATLFAIWIAELTRFGTEIYYYRRGLV